MADEELNSNTFDDLEPDSGDSPSASSGGQTAGLAAKEEELKSLNDKYLRLAAEFDNFKRLAQRDQRDQIRFGKEQLLKELLPVVDNLERAIKAARCQCSGFTPSRENRPVLIKAANGVPSAFKKSHNPCGPRI